MAIKLKNMAACSIAARVTVGLLGHYGAQQSDSASSMAASDEALTVSIAQMTEESSAAARNGAASAQHLDDIAHEMSAIVAA